MAELMFSSVPAAVRITPIIATPEVDEVVSRRARFVHGEQFTSLSRSAAANTFVSLGARELTRTELAVPKIYPSLWYNVPLTCVEDVSDLLVILMDA
jgi:hypothetical protein